MTPRVGGFFKIVTAQIRALAGKDGYEKLPVHLLHHLTKPPIQNRKKTPFIQKTQNPQILKRNA